MKLNTPSRFELGTPLRLEPKRFVNPFLSTLYLDTPVARSSMSVTEFKRLLAHYKRIGFEWSQIWLQTHQQSLSRHQTTPPMIVRTIVEPFEYPEWVVEEWHIKFLLSERLLTRARKQASISNWHEDPLVVATWDGIITLCFRSVEQYYRSFHMLPMVGDRLFNEDTGWRIQDRSIDGDMMTITFTMDG